MKIKNKEEFALLLIATMAKYGYLIETFNFKKELIMMLEDKRYDDLFSFVNKLSDLDIMDVLYQYQELGYIEIKNDEDRITIHIKSNFYNGMIGDILKEFDEKNIADMYRMIRELNVSKCVGCLLYDATVKYNNVNPNGVYQIDRTASIVTDGDVSKISGAIAVEEARFLTISRFRKNKLSDFKIFYKFDDLNEIWRFTKDIMRYYEYLDRRRRNFADYDENDIKDKFEELKDVKGYRYRRM